MLTWFEAHHQGTRSRTGRRRRARKMGFGFERPIGSTGDVLELEYVSALLQTDPFHLRKDGSIRGKARSGVGR